jgi:hypothetical protein
MKTDYEYWPTHMRQWLKGFTAPHLHYQTHHNIDNGWSKPDIIGNPWSQTMIYQHNPLNHCLPRKRKPYQCKSTHQRQASVAKTGVLTLKPANVQSLLSHNKVDHPYIDTWQMERTVQETAQHQLVL